MLRCARSAARPRASARAKQLSRLLLVRAQRRTLRAKARAKQYSRMPGTKTSEKSWMTRSRSANEMQTHENRRTRPPAVSTEVEATRDGMRSSDEKISTHAN
jgi:hypothetical protein